MFEKFKSYLSPKKVEVKRKPRGKTGSSQKKRPSSKPKPKTVESESNTPIFGEAPEGSLELGARAPRIDLTGLTNEENDSEIGSILKHFKGIVFTAENGILDANDVQREHIAILDNGIMLYNKSNPSSPHISTIESRLKDNGIKITKKIPVDFLTLKKIHELSEKPNQKPMEKMQKDFLALVGEAAVLGTSDIHITVTKDIAKIKLRVDGVMSDYKQMESGYAHEFLATAFNMADASDVSYKPYAFQAARISETSSDMPEGVQAVRLQFNPLENAGRHLVARLLYSGAEGEQKDVDELGFSQGHIEGIKRLRKEKIGIVVICGPTGSGKSTTLQRALGALIKEKQGKINVMTVEDPPEYVIDGAVQLPVTNANTEEERRVKFTQAIGAALRSDPDVIMIGEIRDTPSGNLAFAAAMTGHQVWCSLHANNAISILDRFRDLKIDDYKVMDITLMTGLISQRLVRKICPHCSTKYVDSLDLFEENTIEVIKTVSRDLIDDIKVYNTEGCEKCSQTGFAGRTVVAEMILPDLKFMDYIRKNEKYEATKYWLNDMGGVSMLEHAAEKMLMGIVDPRDLEEAVRNLLDLDLKRTDLIHKAVEVAKGALVGKSDLKMIA